MTRTYVQRKPAQRQEAPKQRPTDPAQGSLTAFGADLSSSGASGNPVDLPGAIREKFENAFGADLSAVRLYRSQAVADAGAQAVTMGEKVAFAPGMLDFSSRSGQTLLGHELSHVVSQQRGEVTGSGFLNDPALEARADREGAMAAAGEKIAMPTAALSPVTAAGASGPMQAKKDIDGMAATYGGRGRASRPANSILNSGIGPDQNAYQNIGETAHNPSWFSKKVKGGTDYVAAAQHGLNSASKFTDTHYARTNPDVLKDGGTWGATPVASFASGGLGVLSGLMGTYTGFTSMIRSLRNRKAGASKKDAAEGGLQMLAGLGNIGSGGASTAATALKAGGSLQNLVPGLSIATGGVNALLGLSQLQRASNRKGEIEEQMGNMVPEGPNGTLSDDQKMMLRTMRHGREVQKRNAILGGTKVLGGGLSAIGGVLSLGGVTSAAGLGLGAAGALVNGLGSIYNIWKNRRLRKDAIAQEYGGRSYSEVLKDVRANAGGGKYISRRNAWKIFLKSKTNPNMSEDELYADIRKRRAAHMLHQAVAGDATAAAFIESMGVKPNAQTASGSPTFAEGALDLLAEKLK